MLIVANNSLKFRAKRFHCLTLHLRKMLKKISNSPKLKKSLKLLKSKKSLKCLRFTKNSSQMRNRLLLESWKKRLKKKLTSVKSNKVKKKSHTQIRHEHLDKMKLQQKQMIPSTKCIQESEIDNRSKFTNLRKSLKYLNLKLKNLYSISPHCQTGDNQMLLA